MATVTTIITRNELVNILKTTPNGIGTIANITQYTEPKVTKKDRDTKEPFSGRINKLTVLKVLLNTSYENGVKNQLKREDKAETEYKKGTNTMPLDKSESSNNFFGTYYGKPVIEYRPMENSKPRTKFLLNGKVTSKDKLPNVLPISSKATNQGTDKEIHWRKLYVSNIRKITINGTRYKVVDTIDAK